VLYSSVGKRFGVSGQGDFGISVDPIFAETAKIVGVTPRQLPPTLCR